MATGLDYETKPSAATKKHGEFDPDDFRMTIGEHLEELRGRLVRALIGFAIVLVFCLIYGERVETAFCAPLMTELERQGINPQLVVDELGEGFMVYISISLISAA